MNNSPTDDELMFFAAIGRLTVAWARLELGLDAMVNITWLIGGSDIEPEKPKMLKRKLRYLRKFFNKLKMPDDGFEPYDRLFTAISSQAQFRHDIIHGVLTSAPAIADDVSFVRLLREGQQTNQREISVRAIDILRAAQDAEKLTSRTGRWITGVFDFIANERN